MHTFKYTDNPNYQCLEDMSLVSMEINLVHMGMEQCKPYHAVSATRDTYIVHFVLSGEGFYSVGGVNYSVKPGNMFLIYPNVPHVYCPDTNNPWSYLWIGFKGLRAEAILKQCGFARNRLVLPSPPEEILKEYFEELFHHQSKDYSGILYREAGLLKILGLLVAARQEHLKQGGSKDDLRGKNEHLDTAIDYINTHYMQDIGVADIADYVGISQGYLNHLFTESAKMNTRNYLMEFRMYKAANLLVGTSHSVKEVANLVGYHDQLVFSKAFKRKFELSPKAYRDLRNPSSQNPLANTKAEEE